jgi:hypothetical protein
MNGADLGPLRASFISIVERNGVAARERAGPGASLELVEA